MSMNMNMCMRGIYLSSLALLLACAPADISTQEGAAKTEASANQAASNEALTNQTRTNKKWPQTPQAQILLRDYREFLEIVDGTYDNQEQVYFEDNLEFGQDDRHPRLGFNAATSKGETVSFPDSKITFAPRSIHLKTLDGSLLASGTLSLGAKGIELQLKDCTLYFTRSFDQFIGKGSEACASQMIWSKQGLSITNAPDGLQDGVFRRAQTFKCWVSPRKDDGTYAFYNDVILHDQGGRAWIEGDNHPRVGLKMRNVVWPTGSNRPSLVLYTYKGDDEDTAVSYGWTSPDEPRIGLNLRWMQVSCTKGAGTYTPNINLQTGAGSGK